MKIYQIEKNDGLSEEILSQASLAYCSPVVHNPSFKLEKNIAIGIDNINIEDLFPTKTIYVSIGWNRNDDIFDKYETWAARKTLKNKPFNLQHKPRDVIGHIIDSYGCTFEDDLISDDISDKDIPNAYHLITQGVIYKIVDNRDPELKEEREKLIEEILEGSWYVSMECLFNDFDYGLQSTTGEQSIIKRNEQTAFLTKHLRAYGGKGIYGSDKIGRVIRNLTFIGKGLVEFPANPPSVFLFGSANVNSFNGKLMDTVKTEKLLNSYTKGDISMSEQDVLNEYKTKMATLERELANANQRLKELDEQSVQARLNAKDKEIEVKVKELEDVNSKLDEITASYNDSEKSRKEIESELSTLKESFSQLNSEMSTMKLEAKKVDRVSILVSEGVGREDAIVIVDKFIDLNDEKFTDIVAMQKQIISANSTSDTVVEEEDEEDEVVEETTAEEEELESLVEDEDDVALSAASDDADEEKKEKMTALATAVAEYMRSMRNKKEKVK